MYKILNFLFLIIIFLFFFSIYNYYSSNKHIKNINLNRLNIDEIIKKKITKITVLENDTNDVIVFNDTFSEEIRNETPRSFWNLLKFKWKKKLL